MGEPTGRHRALGRPAQHGGSRGRRSRTRGPGLQRRADRLGAVRRTASGCREAADLSGGSRRGRAYPDHLRGRQRRRGDEGPGRDRRRRVARRLQDQEGQAAGRGVLRHDLLGQGARSCRVLRGHPAAAGGCPCRRGHPRLDGAGRPLHRGGSHPGSRRLSERVRTRTRGRRDQPCAARDTRDPTGRTPP